MRSTAQLDYGNATVARRVQGLHGRKGCGHLTPSWPILSEQQSLQGLKNDLLLSPCLREEGAGSGKETLPAGGKGSNLIFLYTLASVILTLKNTFENPLGLIITNELTLYHSPLCLVLEFLVINADFICPPTSLTIFLKCLYMQTRMQISESCVTIKGLSDALTFSWSYLEDLAREFPASSLAVPEPRMTSEFSLDDCHSQTAFQSWTQ